MADNDFMALAQDEVVMAITLYTGSPGSGKSVHMARELYWHVRMKRPTICNFEIDLDKFKDGSSFHYVPNDALNPGYLIQFSRDYFKDKQYREAAIKLYIDECSIQFGARQWNAPDRKAWIEFFQQHRKLGFEIKLISQMDTMIDKNIRGLIEYEVKHRKVNNYGLFGFVVSCLFIGKPLVCCVRYWYPMKQRLDAEFFLGAKRYYRLYDTYKLFD